MKAYYTLRSPDSEVHSEIFNRKSRSVSIFFLFLLA